MGTIGDHLIFYFNSDIYILVKKVFFFYQKLVKKTDICIYYKKYHIKLSYTWRWIHNTPKTDVYFSSFLFQVSPIMLSFLFFYDDMTTTGHRCRWHRHNLNYGRMGNGRNDATPRGDEKCPERTDRCGGHRRNC